jgi:hypothetical protein
LKTSKILCAALLALAAASASTAFASDAGDGGDGGLPQWTPYVSSTKTRTDVQAELARAKKVEELSQNSHANVEGDMAEAGKTKTRSEVVADTDAVRKANGGWLPTP